MYDRGKVLIGLLVFAAAVTFPFWYNGGSAAPRPALDLDGPAASALKGKECVEDPSHMRSSHMELLNRWRDQAVRHGVTEYVSTNGRRHPISLQETCLDCHAAATPDGDGKQFCITCHDYAGVQADCFTCHAPGKEASR